MIEMDSLEDRCEVLSNRFMKWHEKNVAPVLSYLVKSGVYLVGASYIGLRGLKRLVLKKYRSFRS